MKNIVQRWIEVKENLIKIMTDLSQDVVSSRDAITAECGQRFECFTESIQVVAVGLDDGYRYYPDPTHSRRVQLRRKGEGSELVWEGRVQDHLDLTIGQAEALLDQFTKINRNTIRSLLELLLSRS